MLNSFGISISLLIALFTALSNFAGCAQTKDTQAWVSLVCAHPAKFDNAVNKAINKEIDIPKELSNLFDKEEKMTILPNSTMEVKNFILEKISNA